MCTLPYDDSDRTSIEKYAKRIIGWTFNDVVDSYFKNPLIENRTLPATFFSRRRKGRFGNLIEECYFYYKPNNSPEPDFPKAGVELKVTPFEITKSGKYRAGERLSLSMIDYKGPIESDLEESHFWNKNKLLLLMFYLRNKQYKPMQYPIDYVGLFTPSSVDKRIIENDYSYISEKIINGKAEELSESDTFYLGACTKGATAEKSIRAQYYPPYTEAKSRNFCYKQSYMTYVLNNYFVSKKERCEPLIHDVSELGDQSFADYVTNTINQYIGLTDRQLCNMFGRTYNNNKAQWTDLAYRMLGIKSNKAEEFRKANVTVKIIRIEENGKNKENMSFPPFKYKELIKEEWEDSTLHNYFDETKLLFVVFKKRGESYQLQGSQIWNMPYDDLNTTVQEGWQAVVSTIKEGVKFSKKVTKRGIIVENNLPKQSDNRIVHVRPHASKRYYQINNESPIGDGTKADANELPDGNWMPNYSFWLNNDYILSQLDSSLK